MLLHERMKQSNLSNAENAVVHFLFENKTTIASMTIKSIADQCYVHPSTLIRLSKKLGFSGWIELRDSYLEEINYLESHFQQVDANFPFSASDGIMTIANKLAVLEQTTLHDTLSLLHHDDLQKAKQLLLQSDKIVIFASNANTLISQDFMLKMKRIKNEVSIVTTFGESAYEAHNCMPGSCALLISYTGENSMILQTAAILKQKNIPILSLTSIGDNSLSVLSDASLRVTTRERLYSKIGNFTINTSICYLLDVLYSCVFAEEYQKNLNHLIAIGQQVDKRNTTSSIMQEKEPEGKIQLSDSFLPN
jgi:DNA-binding MurR/RpiR family transcriptional regulator